MATYSDNLKLTLLGTGEGSGTWGDTTNTNLGTLLEQAISGYTTQAIADGADTTITIPDGATGVARNMVIECTGTLTAARNLIVPSNRKLYFVYNNTTGGYAVTVKVSGQTGVSVPNGAKMVLMSNGTDIVEATNYVTFADGTAAAPSITNTGDSNTGIYFPTDDTVGVSTSGTEHMRIDSSGNVGIGTSSPLQRLNVANASITGGGPASSGSAADPNAVSRFQAGAVIMDFGVYAAGQMWIQNRAASDYAINYDLILQPNGGSVGIGTSSPTTALDVNGGIKTARVSVTSPAASDGNVFSGTYTPTLANGSAPSNVADAANSTAYPAQYMRVGNVITVSGKVDIKVTGTGLIQLRLSLPIASAFAQNYQCAGSVLNYAAAVTTTLPGYVQADVTNGDALVVVRTSVTGAAQPYYYTFTYVIV